MIPRKQVNSSNIHSIGYDPDTSTLAVEFSSKKVYLYRNVPQDLADTLNEAESVGKWFYNNIKNLPEYPHSVEGEG